MHRFWVSVAILTVGAGCSTGTKKAQNSQAVSDLKSVCTAGSTIEKARGSVWVKAKAFGSSVQFPAHVMADRGGLELQAVNLLGGQEAVLKITGNKYSLDVPRAPHRNRTGDGQFSGIRVEWLTRLFLGQIPCPKDWDDLDESDVEVDDQGRILAKSGDETYAYSLLDWAGGAWASHLEVRNKKTDKTVHFDFESPEDQTRAVRLWQGTSGDGEIKVKWSSRTTDLLSKN